MNQLSTADLIARIRVMSGLRSNQLYTDAQVLDQAQMALNSLYDIFVAHRQHYFAKSFDFALDGSTNIVALPSDFQTDGTLDYTTLPDRPISVKKLASWLERNRYIVGPPQGWAQAYFLQGGNLEVFPAKATGSYRLWYTPQAPQLSLPSTRVIAIDAGDVMSSYSLDPTHAQLVAANGQWSADRDTGQTIVTAFGSPNTGFNGTFTIRTVLSATTIVLEQGIGGVSTNPASGTITETYQVPFQGTATIPPTFTPWLDYVVVYASFCIRRSRQEETGAYEKQIQELTGRIERVLDRRSEEPGQAPLRALSPDEVLGFRGDPFGGW